MSIRQHSLVLTMKHAKHWDVVRATILAIVIAVTVLLAVKKNKIVHAFQPIGNDLKKCAS